MKLFGREIALKLIAYVVGAVLIVVLFMLLLSQCEKRRNEAAQSRVNASQGEAASDSAKDAINAVAASGKASEASEDLTRQNSRDIQAAPGADQRVNSGVDLAGRKALCSRPAYAADPKCAMFRRQP